MITTTRILAIPILLLTAGCSNGSSTVSDVGTAGDVSEIMADTAIDTAVETDAVTPVDVELDLAPETAVPDATPDTEVADIDIFEADIFDAIDLFDDMDDADVPDDSDVPIAECDSIDDCITLYGDPEVCHEWTCTEALCSQNQLDLETTCDDGEVCTLDDACTDAGECLGQEDPCEDDQFCTADSCESGLGCQHDWMAPKPCADGDGKPGSQECANGEWGDCVAFPECEILVNTGIAGTVNPFIFPARQGEFYVTYVAKGDDGADLKMAWVDPATCAVTNGPLTVNDIPGGVYYWGTQWALSDKSGNFYAVWEADNSLGDISFSASESGLDFSPAVEVVSTSQNGTDPTLQILGPGQVLVAWRGYDSNNYDPYFTRNDDVFGAGAFSAAVEVAESAVQDDQVALAVDDSGNIYLGWQSFSDGTDQGGNMYVAKSTDDGQTWSAPVRVNDVATKANVGKSTFMAWGNGKLHIIWSDTRTDSEGDVYLDSSTDGLTFGADVMVNDDTYRYQEDPSIVIGKGGSCAGILYTVWQDLRSNDGYDVYGARSTDGGATFEANIKINPTTTEDQMNPALAVDETCVIGVSWRDSATNSKFDISATFLPSW